MSICFGLLPRPYEALILAFHLFDMTLSELYELSHPSHWFIMSLTIATQMPILRFLFFGVYIVYSAAAIL